MKKVGDGQLCIWRCKHGTYHLNCGQVTLRLRAKDFLEFQKLFDQFSTKYKETIAQDVSLDQISLIYDDKIFEN